MSVVALPPLVPYCGLLLLASVTAGITAFSPSENAVPRKLSASCGLACEFPCGSRDAVEALAGERKIDVAGYHEVDGED